MKKVGVLLILIILLGTFVLAQNQSNETNNINVNKLKEKTNSLVDKEIIIPDNLQIITKILFGVEDNVTISLIIILALIWIIIFIMLKNILEIMPFFDKKIGGDFIEISTSTIAAIAVTTLISLGGVMKSFAIFFLNLRESFKFLEEWSAGFLLFIIIFLIIIIFLTVKIMSWIHGNIELGKAEETGKNASLAIRVFEDTANAIRKDNQN